METEERVSMKNVRSFSQFTLLLLIIGLFTCTAHGALYSLDIFSSNGSYYDDPRVDINVLVLPEGDQIRFEFHNDTDAELGSCVAEIYFDGDILLGVDDIEEGPGTSFDLGGSPPNLPGGNTLVPAFKVTEGFLVSADNPAPKHGINPGEWVAVIVDLVQGYAFSDVTAQLDDQSLRIGAHLISFADDSSEGAVTPEPLSLGLLLVGGLALSRRKSL